MDNSTTPNKATNAPTHKARKDAQKGGSRSNRVALDFKHEDVVHVELVDTDFVLTLKSGLQALIRDGALRSTIEENFILAFTDEEVKGTALFSEAHLGEWATTPWNDAFVQEPMTLSAVPLVAATTSINPWVAAGVGLAALAIKKSTAGDPSAVDATGTKLTVTAIAGPFIGTQLVTVKDANGQIIAHGLAVNGEYAITLPKGYVGPILVEIAHITGNGNDYIDEKTGLLYPLDAPLRAFMMVTGAANDAHLSVTPATEIAVRLAEKNGPLFPLTTVEETNTKVANALGLSTIYNPVVTIIDAKGQKNTLYNEADGLSESEKYGQLLAKLSSNNVTTGSVNNTLNAYVDALSKTDGTTSDVIAKLLLQGAKTYEYAGDTKTASYATLLAPTTAARTLSAPVSINQTSADQQTGAAKLSDGKTINTLADASNVLADGFINIAEIDAQKSFQLPVALPVEAIPGDTLTLIIPGSNGGAADITTYVLTGNDIGRGTVRININSDDLRHSGEGHKVIMAYVKGTDGAAVSYVAYAVNVGELVFDITAPSPAACQLDASNSFLPNTNNTTTNTQPLLSGTAEAGARIDLTLGTKTYSTTVSELGTWSIQVDTLSPSASGTPYTPLLKTTDTAGNSTTSAGTTFFVVLDGDVHLQNDSVNDTGASFTDNLTYNTSPVLQGRVPHGTNKVQIVLDGKTYSSDATDPALKITLDTTTSAFSFTAHDLQDGTYVPHLLIMQNGTAVETTGTPFTVDTQAPTASGITAHITHDAVNDTGIFDFDNITRNTTPNLTGTGEPGAFVKVAIQDDTGELITTLNTTVSATGIWQVTLDKALDGSGQFGKTYTPIVTVTDVAGNSQTLSDKAFTVDNTKPTLPTSSDPRAVGGLSKDSSTGISNSENNTAIGTPILVGESEAQAQITVDLNEKSYRTVADSDGKWSITIPAADTLANGTYTPQITSTDLAGNSFTYTGITFSVFITKPTVAISTDVTLLKAGTSALIYFTFDSPPGSSFELNDVSASNGLLSNLALQPDSNGLIYTATFTPTRGISGTATLSIASERFQDAAGNFNQDGSDPDNTVSIAIDTIPPTVSLSSDHTTLKAGEYATLTLTFSEAPVDLDLSDIVLPSGKGSLSNLTSVANADGLVYTLTYTPPSGINAIDLQTIALNVKAASFTDAAGNLNTFASNTVNIAVDTLAPMISTVSIGGLDSADNDIARTLVTGDRIKITVNVDQAVTVLGKPTFDFFLDPNAATKHAVYDASLSSNTQMVFTYTIKATDITTGNGITAAANALTILNGSIKDAAGNDADLSTLAIAPHTNAISVDAIAPTIKQISILNDAGADNTFVENDVVTIHVTFSEAVFVSTDEQSGINRPFVNLKVGSIMMPAYYSSGSGTNQLVFTYTISASDTDTDGLSLKANSLTLGNGSASIRDAAGNDARLSVGAVLDNATLLVDTTPPTVTLTRTTNNVLTLNALDPASHTETLTLTLSETPVNFSVADITLGGSGGSISNLVQSSSDPKIWTAMFTPSVGQTTAATLSVNAGTFNDKAGNLNPVSNTLVLAVDTVKPDQPSIQLVEDTASIFNPNSSTVDGLTSKTALLTRNQTVGATVQYRIAGGTGAATAPNTWVDLNTYNDQIAALPDGVTYTIQAQQIDGNGNISEISSSLIITKDTSVSPLSVSLHQDTSNGLLANVGDLLTQNPTLDVSGIEADAVVQYRIGANGAWLSQAAYDAALAASSDGMKAVAVRQIDKAGNISELYGMTFTLDRTGPTATLITCGLAHDGVNDTGNPGDNLTSNPTPVLAGTAEAGAKVDVRIAGVTYSTFASSAGVWQVAVGTGSNSEQTVTGTALPLDGSTQDGKTYTPVITVTDAAGNATTVTGSNITIDTTAPTPPTIGLNASSDTGISNDNQTYLTKPTLEGLAEANAKVSVQINGSTYTTYADNHGAWIINPTTALFSGINTPTITIIDGAGNATSLIGKDILVDYTPPKDPQGGLAVDATNDTGVSDSDHLTNNTTPMLVGIAEAGATVDVTVNGELYTTTASDSNKWFIEITKPLGSGTYVPNVKVTDAAGNANSANITPITIDVDAPQNATGGLQSDATNDTGLFPNDNLTNNSTPTISGFAEAGARVDVLLNNQSYTQTSDAKTGAWSIKVNADLPSSAIAYVPSIKVTDPAGNSTSFVDGKSFFVDRTPPTVSIDYDVNGAGHALLRSGQEATLTFTFSEIPVGFSLSDIEVEGNQGKVSNLVQDATNPLIYRATFQAQSGLTNEGVSVHVGNAAFTDIAGNANIDSDDPDNTVDITANTSAATVKNVVIAGVDSVGTIKTNALIVGDQVKITVTMSNTVTISGGSPSYQFLLDNNVLRTASYSGTGALSDTLTFYYTVKPGDTDNASGITAAVNALQHTGISVVDKNGNLAELSVPAIVDNSNNIRIDTTPPTVEITRVGSATLNSINQETLVFTFSEDPGDTFTASDITVGGSGGSLGTLSAKQINPATGKFFYTITIAANPDQSTPVTVQVNAGQFNDPATNSNIASGVLNLAVDTHSMPDPSGGLSTDLISDTGVSGDNLTKNTTPFLKGTAEAGSKIDVRLTINGVEKTYSTVALSDKTWIVQVTDTLYDNALDTSYTSYTPIITSTNANGNSKTSTGTTFHLDTRAPKPPTWNLVHDATNDSGFDTHDFYTNQKKPILVGLAEGNATVDVTLGNETYTTTADATGSWTLTIDKPLSDGVYIPHIKATDAAGNSTLSSAFDSQTITIDTTAPLQSGITGYLSTDPASDTGVSGDGLTGETAPKIQGSAEINAHISVLIDGKTYTTIADSTTGEWSIQIGSAQNPGHTLNAGTWIPSITAIDMAGNATTTTGKSITIVTSAIDPTIELEKDTAGGAGTSSDHYTNDWSLITQGVQSNAQAVEYKIVGGSATGIFQSYNNYKFEMGTLSDGAYTVYVRQKDQSGVYSPGASFLQFTKDTTALAPSISLTNDTGNGTANSTIDKITSDAHLNVSDPETGGKLEYKISDATPWSDTYDLSAVTAQNGYKSVQVRQIDRAGNMSSSSELHFTFDNTAPDYALISGELRPGSTGNTGVSDDTFTNLVTPYLSGAAELSTLIEVSLNIGGSLKTYNTTADGLGNWIIQVVDTLTDGQTYQPFVKVTDAAGNYTSKYITSFTVDTTAPTVAITGNVSSLKAGDTALITFTFSEDPDTSFITSDIVATGGSINNLQQTANPLIWTADFTPKSNFEGPCSISIASNKFSDAAGNVNVDGADSNNYLQGTIDTKAATVSKVVLSGETPTGEPKSSTLIAGDVVKVAVTLSEVVKVTGTPEFQITLNNGVTKQMSYMSGSDTNTLIFKYTIAAGDTDSVGGITAYANSLGLGSLGTATITDVFGNLANLTTPAVPAGSNTLSVDTTPPTVTITRQSGGTYTLTQDSLATTNSDTLVFTFSEDPGTSFDINDITVTGGSLGPLTGSGLTRTALFTPFAKSTTTATLQVLANQFQDAALNGNTASNVLSMTVDTQKPSTTGNVIITGTDSSNSPKSANALQAGDKVRVTLTMDESVVVSGVPTYTIMVGSTQKIATYDANFSTTTKLVFIYTVQTGDFDNTGGITSEPNALVLGGGSLRDLNGNQANLNVPAAASNTVMVDAVAPAIKTVSLANNAGLDNTYKAGDTVTANIEFYEVVTVTEVPYVNLNIGGILRKATYAGGSNSTTLTFNYTIVQGDTDSNGIGIDANAVSLGSGNIKDLANNVALLTHNAVTESVTQRVDTTSPSVSIQRSGNNILAKTINNSELITFTVSEDPGSSFDLSVVTSTGGTWGALSTKIANGDGTYSYTATFTPNDNSTANAVVQISAGQFTDLAGNPNVASNTLTMLVDTVAPIDPSISLSVDSFNSANSMGTAIDQTTNTTTLNTGKVESNATVEYAITGGSASGVWKNLVGYNTEMDGLADDTYTIRVRQRDSAGNLSAGTNSLVITKDTTVGNLTLKLRTDSSNGMSPDYASDLLTNTPDLTATQVTTEANTVTQYRIGSGAWMTLSEYNTAMLTGGWAGSDGIKTVSARQVDLAGNISNDSTITFTLDRTPPATTHLTGGLTHDAISDTGTSLGGASSNNDNITKNTTPWLDGTAEPGSKVAVTITNGVDYTQTYTTIADAALGTWRVQVTRPMSNGTYTSSLVVTDIAGNVSNAKVGTAFTVDLTPPTLTISATDSAGNAVSTLRAGDSAVIKFSFSETVSDFGLSDIVYSGGTLSNLSQISGALYTAVFTPLPGLNAGNASFDVGVAKYTDAAGTLNTQPAAALSLTYDTSAPDITGVTRTGSSLEQAGTRYQTDAILNLAEMASDQTASFTLSFSEKVKGLSASNLMLSTSGGIAIANGRITVSANAADANGYATTWLAIISGLNTIPADSLRLNLANKTGIVDTSGNTLISNAFTVGDAYVIDTVAPATPILTSGVTAAVTAPKITGQSEANAMVTVTAGGATYVTQANAAGSWWIDTSQNTTNTQTCAGTYTSPGNGNFLVVSCTATDAAGNTSASSSTRVTINTSAPLISTLESTNNTTPKITGMATANTFVNVTVGGASYTVKSNSQGFWIVDTAFTTTLDQTMTGVFTPVSNGALIITASIGSNSTTAALLVDTLAPNTPIITSGLFTNSSTPIISGTADAFTKLQVNVGGASFTTTSDINGSWQINTAYGTNAGQTRSGTFNPISNGVLTPSVLATDAAGNISARTSQTLTVDTTPPNAASINNQPVTGDNTPVLTGLAEAGATVTITANHATYQVITGSDGKWSLDTGTATPSVGVYNPPTANTPSINVTVSQVDQAGNAQTAAASSMTLLFDNSYPVITSGLYTTVVNPVVYGTTQGGKTVTVSLGGATYITTADVNGIWRIDTAGAIPVRGNFTPLTEGSGTYTVTATVDDKSTSQTLDLDMTGPTVTISDPIAGDNIISATEQGSLITGTVEVGATVTLNFGSTLRTATVKSDGSWIYQMNANDVAALGQSKNSVTGDKSIIITARDRAGNITMAARNVTVDTLAPTLDLDRANGVSRNFTFASSAKNTEYSLDNGTVIGGSDAAIGEANPITKITIGINPVMPPNGSFEYLLIGDKSISTTGSNMPSAVVFAGVTWNTSYNAGVLTLQASSTPADALAAQALLRNIRYTNTSPGPMSMAEPDRVFTFTVYDQAGNASASATSTVTVDTVGPVISLDTSISAGDLVHAVSANTLTALGTSNKISVVEKTLVRQVTLTVNGVIDGNTEQLIVNGTVLNADGSNIDSANHLVIDGTAWHARYDAGTFTFTDANNNDVTAAQAQALLQALQYKDASANATGGPRTFTIAAQDTAGNITATPAVAAVIIKTVEPSPASVTPLVTLDANGDGLFGDQFYLSFNEAVQSSLVTSVANWTVEGGGSIASIAAVNPVIVNGVSYAKQYLVTAGHAFNTGAQMSIGTSFVIDASDKNSVASSSFIMPDVIRPLTPTPPVAISEDNQINAQEKSGNTSIEFTTDAASAGDHLLVYRDGILIQDLAMEANSTTTTATFTGDDWGAVDGMVSIYAKVKDAAGNYSLASTVKPVTVDTVVGDVQSLVILKDTGAVEAFNTGDVIRITFQETVNFVPGLVFGSYATATPVNPVNGKATTWDITLGDGVQLTPGDTLSTEFGTVTDIAGNSSDFKTVTMPSTVFNLPTAISIETVATNNVIDASERAKSQSINLNLTGAKSGDVINLYMDSILVGNTTVSSEGQTLATINLAPNAWGGDGERVLTAAIQRGNSSPITASAHSVYVAADGNHWSSSGVLWFDPDTLTDNTLSTWTASAGGGTATRAGGSALPTLMVTSNGHQGLNFATYGQTVSLKSYYIVDTNNLSMTLPKLSNSISVFAASYQPTQDGYLNIFARYGTDKKSQAMQLGVDNRMGLSPLPQRLTLDLNDVYPFGADASGTVGNWLVAQFDTINNNYSYAISSNGLLSGTGDFLDKDVSYQLDFSRTIDLFVIGDDTSYHSTNLVLGDEIYTSDLATAVQAQEINTYLAAKYQTVGTSVATRADNTYDLTTSNSKDVLIDERLILSDRNTADKVTVAGADYVNTGANNDLLIANDLSFRTLDGGLGYDTLVLGASDNRTTDFVLSDFVSNARGNSGVSADDNRVAAAGFHKLLGIEHLDFSQNLASQHVTIAVADVDQLAEKNIASDPQHAENTSNLYVELGSNDDLSLSGFAGHLGLVEHGYWLDPNGTAYDRHWSSTIGSDPVNVYVRGGDSPADFDYTATAASYTASGGTTNFGLTFNEPIVTGNLKASDFSIVSSAGSAVATSVITASNGLSLAYSGNLSGVVRVIYQGNALTDGQGDQIRYKDISIGTSGADAMDGSTLTTDQALFGGRGNDAIKGGSGDDLLMGQSGNDVLTGGAGADTFRFMQFETGSDTITDFNVRQGDKLDLHGLLSNTRFNPVTNYEQFLQLSTNGTDVTLKVDTTGIGNFAAPDQSISLLNAQLAGLTTLDALMAQRVLLV